ncbi:aminoglycoside phosphotransferase family protein [Micromonospora phytophila]|uniref:phosphotransferase n=1 Tax=Micromonospora phytophila TaxID=709888 RepID=UPI002030E506|nr:phosphotransferase [Micromonospora phytophila]MCM0674607.1 aminoglycoside phosphotransferase family protein [Micromonospora phytophila]
MDGDAGGGAVAVGWDEPGWRAEALDWVTGELARQGRRVTGPVEARVRPWSLVWRVPTDTGDTWFKANNPGTLHEAGLLAALARLAPGRVLDPIAADPGRGWSLLPDGGGSLRDLLAREGDLTRWERILPEYADLQRTVAVSADELLSLGVPDHRPERLSTLFAQLLDDEEALLIGREGGLTAEAHERLRAHRPSFAGKCRRLAESGIAPTIQHDDLHDGNVFAAADGYRFFDWGDASVAHPFGSLLVTIRSVAHTFELGPGDPALGRLRDAYLEAWTDRHDRAALRETATLAVDVTKVSRALSWRRALDTPDPARVEYAAAVPGWLEELFAPDPR